MNIASIPATCFYCGQTVFASSMNSEVVLTHDFEEALERHRQTECPFYASLRDNEFTVDPNEASANIQTQLTKEEAEAIQKAEIKAYLDQVPTQHSDLSDYVKFVPTNFVTGKKARRQAVFRKRSE